ncbi:D-glycero-beta-D-manno-heptose 1,7-bisphosphate 7-phosphatase [Biformimicrobium ophioploci]|uniref:D,D-heptose 1,7-bisphosphate phosphatase n=1 Tax=Biformimicrobium ophioploci TaxID=3036711 RepID=A0ABQ6LVD6_9GAMM|nr:D-glycero-beta-D-manno-heptose 1,7-bisphosphate 7-phosphatase [Microbulbifer sp. NKW57]GMG86039.1 D-glycero-beta-D-manno-heptose 1,7-bisphosphate 7-phosphatase [Microbulbifer sp. NKW57]
MRLIILDRDGVINQDSDAYVKSVDEWIPLPGSVEAIAELNRAGYSIVVATNQSGLGRGYFDLDDLEAMHDKMRTLVEDAGGTIAGIFYCPHAPEDNCRCRKPLPGLIDVIEAELDCSVHGCYLVGDSLRDLEAGLEKGCKPVLVRTGKGEKTLRQLIDSPREDLSATQVFDDLAGFANYLLGHD